MSTLRPTIRARVYGLPEFGEAVLGFASTATGAGTTGIPDTVKFGPTQIGEFQYADGWGYVPTLTGAQRVKRMGAISGTTLLHADNANWSSVVNTTPYEWLVPGAHPDAFNQVIADAMRELYVRNHLPETPWIDGNFELSGTTNWAAAATLAKVADAIYGNVGSQSLKVTNLGANGYAAHNVGIEVQPGQRWQFHALMRNVAGGPARFRIYDYTASPTVGAEIGTAAVAYGFTPTLLVNNVTIPENCYRVTCLLQNDSATGITAWDALPGRNLASRQFPLDYWGRAHYNITGLAEAQYGTALKNGTRAYDATSRSFEAWSRPRDFDTEHLLGNSTPNIMRIYRDPRKIASDVELWYPSQRTWWDVDPLDSETASSEIPEELLIPLVAARVATLLNPGETDPHLRATRAKYEAIAAAQVMARPAVRTPERRQRVGGRLGP